MANISPLAGEKPRRRVALLKKALFFSIKTLHLAALSLPGDAPSPGAGGQG
jgi:hypothetical protein